MMDMFYRNFEDKHRGSFELIQSRLKIYLPFINPLKQFYNRPKALDLGCGRGEWLDLLQQNDFNAQGIDLNEGMLEECKKRGLSVIHGDAIQYLKTLETGYLSIISAFHLVEHIPFEILQELIREAHRVLKPGGLLILETPNPESILVGTSSFYLDPTHQRPIPSELLSFIVEYNQFNKVKMVFLQEEKNNDENEIGLRNILEGVSPDYAVVAQKEAEPSLHAAFSEPFTRQYGIRLIPLAKKYDRQIKTQIHNLHVKNEILQHKLETTTTAIALRDLELNQINSELSALKISQAALQNDDSNKRNYSNIHETLELQASLKILEKNLFLTQSTIQNIERELRAIYNSKSWIITKPLRQIAQLIRRLKNVWHQKNKANSNLIKQLIPKKKYLLINTTLLACVKKQLDKHPRIKHDLHSIMVRLKLIKYWPAIKRKLLDSKKMQHETVSITQLSQRATSIYKTLGLQINKKDADHANYH